MQNQYLKRLAQKSKICLRKNSSTILTCLGAVGVILTSVLAVKATPKAMIRIRSDSMINHDGDPDGYTKMELIESAWICYVPAVVVGTSTIACIFGANILNKRQQASLASAYALVSNQYHDYKSKLKELYGEEIHNKIVDEIVKEEVKDVYLSCPGLCSNSTLDFNERDNTKLFYDSFSRRYFESTVSQVLQAEYHLNRNWALGMQVTLTHFYEFLGLDKTDCSDELTWFWDDEMLWIDFDHHKTILDDGLEVFVIDFINPPRLDSEE